MAVPAPPVLTVAEDPSVRAAAITVQVPAGATRINLWRTGPSGVRAGVRGFDPAPVAPGQILARDYEAPIGVPLYYYGTAGNTEGDSVVGMFAQTTVNVLQNPSGAEATTGWSVFINGGVMSLTVADDADLSGGGMQVDVTTPATAASTVFFPYATDGTSQLNLRPVSPGEFWAVRARMKITRQWVNTPSVLALMLRCDNAAGSNTANVIVATSAALQSISAGTIIDLAGVAQIPANCAFAGPQLTAGNQPGASGAHVAGNFLMSKVAASGSPVPDYFDGDTPNAEWLGAPYASESRLVEPIVFTLVSAGCSDTWLNDLARVGNTMNVTLEQIPELAYPVPNTVHEVITRRAPIVTSDVAHTAELEVSILTESDDERARARALLGNGVPILLRTPPEDGIGNMYLSVLDFKEQRVVTLGTVTDRRFVISARHVARPDPTLYAPSAAVLYDDVRDAYATYDELRTDRATYDALLYGWGGTEPSDIVPWPPSDV